MIMVLMLTLLPAPGPPVMLSPPSFKMSSPDSGMSPEVDCDTAIFLAINRRHSICAVLS